jgi:FkbM family methyltransferase
VGANIGDTTCLISQVVPGSFLCIEGDPGYFSILKENVQTMNLSVTCVQAFCGDNDGQMEGVITVKDGTGYFAVNDNQKTVMTSLQNIIMDNPEFQYANLLKIDTDGFDFSVSRGAQKLLAESGPTVFFEFVPATLINKGEQPLEIFSYFLSLGYQHGLFYDNFGLPLAVVDMDDRLTLAEMIKRTNNNQTSYFDILLPGRNLDSKWFHLFCEEEFAYGAKCSELHETIIKYSLSMPLKLKII